MVLVYVISKGAIIFVDKFQCDHLLKHFYDTKVVIRDSL